MAIKIIAVKCPECGADLNVEEGRSQVFCTYCGTKVLLHNENEFVYRTIDEAGVAQAETDRIIRLREMDLVEKKEEEKKKKLKIALWIFIGSAALMVIGGILAAISGDSNSPMYMLAMLGLLGVMGAGIMAMIVADGNKEKEEKDGKVPSSIDEFEKKNYQAIEAIFKSAGFTDVKSIPLNDLTTGLIKKPGTVESITIGGTSISSYGGRFLPDDPVIISYHSISSKGLVRWIS